MKIASGFFLASLILLSATAEAQSPRKRQPLQRIETSKIQNTKDNEPKLNAPAPTFHAHTTDSPQTLKPGQVAYIRNSGVDPTATTLGSKSGAETVFTFLTQNSVSIGTFNWLTIGTNPLFWLIEGSRNGSAKFRLFHSDMLTFSFGYSHLSFTSLFNSRSDGFSLNLLWRINPYMSLAHSSVAAYASSDYGNETIGRWSQPSHFFDFEQRLSRQFTVTPSVSWSQGQLDPTQYKEFGTRTLGVGSSVTWMTPKGWFADPSMGAQYYPKYSSYQAMFSIYFH